MKRVFYLNSSTADRLAAEENDGTYNVNDGTYNVNDGTYDDNVNDRAFIVDSELREHEKVCNCNFDFRWK